MEMSSIAAENSPSKAPAAQEPAAQEPAAQGPTAPASASRSASDRLLIVVALLLIFSMAARTPIDSDLWWHLSAGQETLRQGAVLRADVFSYTRAGTPWINAFWMFDIAMLEIYRAAGYLGLGLLVALLAVLSMGIVSLQSDGPVALKVCALLLGSVVASVGWPPRPLLSSLVLLALVGYIVYLYKRRGTDRLWTLPLIFALWSNLHGGYPLGILLIGAVIAGEVLNHLLKLPVEHVLPWSKILRLGLWTAACGFAVLANPNGIDMWLLPFQTVNIQVLQNLIPEWAAPDFHFLIQQSLLWLLLAVFGAVALSGRVMDGGDLLVVLGFAYMAMLARRNFSPFAVVAVPVLIRYAAYALAGWQERVPWLNRLVLFGQPKVPETPRILARKKVLNLLIVAILGFVAAGKLYIVTYPALVAHFLEDQAPVQAVEWLVQNQPPGRIFNEYDWGGYLQWQARDFPVFVDGRTDLYGDPIIGEWIATISAQPGWQDTLDRYHVSVVLVRPDRPLAEALAGAGWKLVYKDEKSVLYARSP
jgi:hypothetical protein